MTAVRKSLLAVIAAAALTAGGTTLRAQMPTTAPATQPAIVNTMCPVTGEAIDKSITVAYDGKTYGFCCPDCVKTFKADPAKYAAKAK